MLSGARSKRPRKYVDQSFLHSKSTTQSSEEHTSSESAAHVRPMPAVRVPSTPSGISPTDTRIKSPVDSGKTPQRTWQRPLFEDFDFGRSQTPPSPRTREAEDRVRRFLMNEAPPVPQDVEERVHAIESAQVAKRVARPKASNISSKSKALEPGQPSTGLGITYSSMPKIPEKDTHHSPGNLLPENVSHERETMVSEGAENEKIPTHTEENITADSSRPEQPRAPPRIETSQPKPKTLKTETHKLQKSPTKSEKGDTTKPRGILKYGPSYIPKTQSTANSNSGFWAVMFALNMIGILSALEATILSTALPTLIEELEGDDLYMWAVNAYFLASTVFQPFYAQMANVFGHRWLTLGAVAIFAAGSAVCGGAVNIQMLIGGRAIQGMGGGGITILVDLVVQDLVPAQQRGTFLAFTFLTLTVGNGVGPFVGGIIVENINWSWIFLINIPAAGLALILLFLFLKESGKTQASRPKVKRIDFVGNVILIGAMTSVLFALTFGGSQYPWSAWQTLVPLAVGGFGLVAFTLYESSSYCLDPIVPLSLFGNRTSAAAFVLSFLHSLITIWVIYFLPVYFQGAQGNSASLAGVQILPSVLVMVVAAAVSGKLLNYLDHYRPMHFAGFALMTTGLGLFTMLKIDSGAGMWIGFQILIATGGGLVIRSLLPAVLVGLTERQEASATATWGFIRNFGIMWGVAIPSVLINNEISVFAPYISNIGVREKLLNGRVYELATATFLKSLSHTDAIQVREAITDTLQAVWYVATGIAGFAFLLVLFEADIPLRKKSIQLPAGVKATPQKFDIEATGDRDEKAALISRPQTARKPSAPLPSPATTTSNPSPVSRPPMARPVTTMHRLRSRYASIPIMLDETNELEETSPVSDMPDRPSSPHSTLPTPPEFGAPAPTIRAPWNRRNSWAPWTTRGSRASAHANGVGSWYGDGTGSNAEKEVTPGNEPSSTSGSRPASEFGQRFSRVLSQIPRDFEEELSQIGEWESYRRSTSSFNFVV